MCPEPPPQRLNIPPAHGLSIGSIPGRITDMRGYEVGEVDPFGNVAASSSRRILGRLWLRDETPDDEGVFPGLVQEPYYGKKLSKILPDEIARSIIDHNTPKLHCRSLLSHDEFLKSITQERAIRDFKVPSIDPQYTWSSRSDGEDLSLLGGLAPHGRWSALHKEDCSKCEGSGRIEILTAGTKAFLTVLTLGLGATLDRFKTCGRCGGTGKV